MTMAVETSVMYRAMEDVDVELEGTVDQETGRGDDKYQKRRLQELHRLERCLRIFGILVALYLLLVLCFIFAVFQQYPPAMLVVKQSLVLEEILDKIPFLHLDEKYEEWFMYHHSSYSVDSDVSQEVTMIGTVLNDEEPAFPVLKTVNDLLTFQNSKGYAFVMHVIDWDRWCKKFLPEWQQLALKLRKEGGKGDEKIEIAVFENSGGRVAEVEIAPTFLLYHQSNLVAKYFGNRTVESFMEFLDQQLHPTPVVPMSEIVASPKFRELKTKTELNECRDNKHGILFYDHKAVRVNSTMANLLQQWNAFADPQERRKRDDSGSHGDSMCVAIMDVEDFGKIIGAFPPIPPAVCEFSGGKPVIKGFESYDSSKTLYLF